MLQAPASEFASSGSRNVAGPFPSVLSPGTESHGDRLVELLLTGHVRNPETGMLEMTGWVEKTSPAWCALAARPPHQRNCCSRAACGTVATRPVNDMARVEKAS